jgi:hypothetical protein
MLQVLSMTISEERTIGQCGWSAYCGIADDDTVYAAFLDNICDLYELWII